MNIKTKFSLIFFFALAIEICSNPLIAKEQSKSTEKPNILLMLADDMGWKDLSSFGNDRVPTPNIDRIAENGMKMTQFYSASAVCTPTRASILTGKYPLRFDIRRHFSDNGEFLPLCNTLPKLLKSAGYSTAHIGKWHLGGVREQDVLNRKDSPGPKEHGFDSYLTQLEQQPLRGEMGRKKVIYREGGTCLLSNEKKVGKENPYYNMYLTDILGEEAIRLIDDSQHNKNPFFINLWWLAPHTPYEPAPEPHWSQTAEEGISEDQHRFRSMVARMDYQVGRILDRLDELGIADNTMILFVSDNGGAYEANIGSLKGGKTDLHEGGIRVPFLASWPGHIEPRTQSNILGHSTDLLPTLCSVAGVPLPNNDTFDGLDLLPLLTGKKEFNERGTVFWQIDMYKHLQRHYLKPEPYATEIVRQGQWKMLALNGKPVELFDVQSDIEEKYNLLSKQKNLVKSLQKELETWLAEDRQYFGNAGK